MPLALPLQHLKGSHPGQQLSRGAVDGIIENYVDYLIQQGRHPRLGRYNAMVALYVRLLPGAVQVGKYAGLLEGFMLHRQAAERSRLIQLAQDRGLDVSAILDALADKLIASAKVRIGVSVTQRVAGFGVRRG
jgi:hypothetical protein